MICRFTRPWMAFSITYESPETDCRFRRIDLRAIFSAESRVLNHPIMAKPKLDLYSKTDGDLEQFAITHQDKLLANPAFPTPAPPAAEFTAALAQFGGDVDEVEQAA